MKSNGEEAALTIQLVVPENLIRLLRRYARRSKRLRPMWKAMTENKTAEEMGRAARALMATLMREAVELTNAEEGGWCPYHYIWDLLELNSREVADALSNALAQNGLVAFKDERWCDVWQNRSGSYYTAGAIGEPQQYMTLTEKGEMWAARNVLTDGISTD